MSFIGEIKRRRVFQVAAVYLVVSWLIMQVVDVVNEPLNLPDWFDSAVIVALAIGLPIALILAWAFDLTPDGVVKDQGTNVTAQSGSRRIEYVLFGLLVLAVGFMFVDNYVLEDGNETTQVAASQSTTEPAATYEDLPNSVAVLPFANLSPDPDNAFFAAGIHESTLNQLAKIRDLTVMARTSVIQYEQNPLPIPEIAKALNVEMVMEGSVRYANGRVLITAQLIDGRSGAHLWSDEFNRELTDVFAVQAEIAEHIATAMQIQLLADDRARLEQPPTESAEAYQHYLRAVSTPDWNAYPEYRPLAIESLKRAIAADPEFSSAHTGLAIAYYIDGDRDLAVDYAQKSIELDSKYGAHAILGINYSDYYARNEEGRAELLEAIENSQNDATTLAITAIVLANLSGDYIGAKQSVRRALAINPNDDWVQKWAAMINIGVGDLAAAAKSAREAVRLAPDNYDNLLTLAAVEYLSGKGDATKENLDRSTDVMSSGATFRVEYVAYLYGLIGEIDQTTKLLARLEQLYDDSHPDRSGALAWAILGTRDKERALREWRILVNSYIEENRRVNHMHIGDFRDNLLNDPMLEEPEFLELRRRLGFKG